MLNRIKVEDEGYAANKLAAWACIRLDRVQTGYRLIKLLDAKGIATDGLLLVKIEKTVVGVEERSLLTRSAKLAKFEG
jgi:phosphatidylinositol phospholipase C, delta